MLRQNIQYFRQLAQHIPGMANQPALPIFLLPDNINEQALSSKQIIISSFAYPNPQGKRIRRVVLNALHTKADLEYLAECLAAAVLTT